MEQCQEVACIGMCAMRVPYNFSAFKHLKSSLAQHNRGDAQGAMFKKGHMFIIMTIIRVMQFFGKPSPEASNRLRDAGMGGQTVAEMQLSTHCWPPIIIQYPWTINISPLCLSCRAAAKHRSNGSTQHVDFSRYEGYQTSRFTAQMHQQNVTSYMCAKRHTPHSSNTSA